MTVSTAPPVQASQENVQPARTTGTAAARASRRPVYLLLFVIVAVSALATIAAMRRTSTTFDEIVMMAGGARGFETGRFDLAPEHPPLTQYLYGLPVHLSSPNYPADAEVTTDFGYRYAYASVFFWHAGNDPERLAFLGRLMGVACVVLLVLGIFFFTAARWGAWTGLLAAALVAFLPDLLAHGGVAYNDVPLALFFFTTIWAFDALVRKPGWRPAVLAGASLALALAVKFSAVAVLPVLALLLAMEAAVRGRSADWIRAVAFALVAATVTGYLALVAVYRGDNSLAEFFYGLDYTFMHVGQGHGAPGYLLGSLSTSGWWYFFPVAFLFKTPAAFHILILLGVLGAFAIRRSSRSTSTRVSTDPRTNTGTAWRAILLSQGRGPLLGLVVFCGALLVSNLNIGFRYALPALPLLCILVAVGVARLWHRSVKHVRIGIVALVLWMAGSSLSYYPHFLTYISEYGPGREHNHEVLLDSSLDWGQGLLELRRFMEQERIDRIFLSYFGSAHPRGYGIDYVALASFFPLPVVNDPAQVEAPRWVAISATNLHGVYLPGDPFAAFRELEPYRVLGNSILVYRLDE